MCCMCVCVYQRRFIQRKAFAWIADRTAILHSLGAKYSARFVFHSSLWRLQATGEAAGKEQ